MTLIGFNARIFRNAGTLYVPDWVEVSETQDQAVSEGTGEADATTRRSNGIEESEPLLLKKDIEFKIKHGCDNAKAFYFAYKNRNPLDLAIMDGTIENQDPCFGIRGRFKVFEFSIEQSLRRVLWDTVKIKTASHDVPPEDFVMTNALALWAYY